MARKLSGEASPEEIRALEVLMQENPALQYAYEMMADHWNAGAWPDEQDVDSKFLQVWQTIGERKSLAIEKTTPHFKIPRLRIVKWVAAAACIAMVTAAALFIFKGPEPSGLQSEVSTRYGSRSKVVLPDGSKVWLNAGSRLTYDPRSFSKEERSVQLVGEAFFDVVPAANMPFTVHTQTAKIKVLGTTFDIRAYPEDNHFEASLITGAIEVLPHSEPGRVIRLKPGQRLTLAEDKHKDKVSRPAITIGSLRTVAIAGEPDSLILETAWTENKLAFTSETFAALATKMERWYNVKINFADNEVKQYRFTGVFEDETLEQALSALQLTGSFRYRIVRNEIFIEQ